MNYFQLVPQELINEVCFYLDYNESLIIRELFAVKVNYLPLLAEKYPGFYQIIKDLRTHDVKYESLTFEEAYLQINLLNSYLEYAKSGEDLIVLQFTNIKSKDPDDIKNILYENDIWIGKLRDIIASHSIIEQRITKMLKQSEYYKYRNYFPCLPNMDDEFTYACDEFDYYKTRLDDLTSLIEGANMKFIYTELLLYVLDIPNIPEDQRIKISSKDPSKIIFENVEEKYYVSILYQYILKHLGPFVQSKI